MSSSLREDIVSENNSSPSIADETVDESGPSRNSNPGSLSNQKSNTAAKPSRAGSRSSSSSAAASRSKNSRSRSNSANVGVRKWAMSNSLKRNKSNFINDQNRDFVAGIVEDSVGSLRIPGDRIPSHHRRTSFFNNLHSEPRANSGLIPAANQYDFDGLANALNEHISSTQAQLQCSPYTLSFVDETDEDFYTEFIASFRLRSWLWMGILGIFVIGAMQALMALTLPQAPSKNELYLIIMVYIPLTSIVTFAYFANDAVISKHLQLLSFLYVLVAGPVFIIGRAWLIQTQSTIFVLSPIYITILYCSTYFFDLRYIYSLVIALISLAGWFVVAIISWNWKLTKATTTDNNLEQRAYFIWSGVAVVLAMFFMCALAYNTEWNNRLQFLSNQQLIIFNSKLQRQLKGLEHTYSSTIADLESPLEKAIANIKLLLASPQLSDSQIRILHEILECLNSSHLMAPDLYHQVRSGEVIMDKEEEKWLFNELVKSQKEANSLIPEISEGDDSQERTKEISIESADISSFSTTSVNFHVKDCTPIDTCLSPEVHELLQKIQEYNFPIFQFAEATQNRPLVVMAHTLIIQSGIAERLQLPIQKLMNFLYSVENGYRKELTFHNSIHAADVLHGIHYLCQLDKIQGIFSDLETLSIYIAASIHDLDHPGVNNNFLIATRDKKALLYNDKSVLENHHCSVAFNLLLKTENNFFEMLDRKAFSTVRSFIVDMVLVTDLAQHFDLLTRFKKKVVTAGSFDPFGSQDDKSILMQMLMKCSDVSNPTKEWTLYQEWINRILQEFYNQGDLEKKMGLQISPFMNRASPGPSAQKGFIEYIVYPLFEALESWTDITEIKRNLDASRDRFCNPSGVTEGSSSGIQRHKITLRLNQMNLNSSQVEGEGIASKRKFSEFGGMRRKPPSSRTGPPTANSTRSYSTIGLLSSVFGQGKGSAPAFRIREDREEQRSNQGEPITGQAQSKDEDPFPRKSI